MATSAASYRGLIRLQKLNKAQAEMELSRLNTGMAAIAKENEALFKMQDDRFEPNASFIPADIIIKRLETNRALEGQLADKKLRQAQDLLRSSRTIDILGSRLRSHENQLQRAEAAVEMDEYISHLLAKHTN